MIRIADRDVCNRIHDQCSYRQHRCASSQSWLIDWTPTVTFIIDFMIDVYADNDELHQRIHRQRFPSPKAMFNVARGNALDITHISMRLETNEFCRKLLRDGWLAFCKH